MLVPDVVRQCVGFVCYKDSAGVKLGGTMFLFSMPSETIPNIVFVYLVTARHVIDGIANRCIDGLTYLRLNKVESGTDLIPVPLTHWLRHEDASVDVAALSWAPPRHVYDYRCIGPSMAATDEVIERESIGVGDEVFLTGLFVNHYGQQRNRPIVRIGNIALMPEEPVATRDLGAIEAYLIEARSIGGLSGSPVFVHLSGIRAVEDKARLISRRIYLLGLMHGHWDMPVSTNDSCSPDASLVETVNMGIGIVVPWTKIEDLLYCPQFREARTSVEQRSLTH